MFYNKKLKHLYDTDLKRKTDHTIEQTPKMNTHNEKTQIRNKRNTIIEKTLTLHCVECLLCAKRTSTKEMRACPRGA